MKKTGFLIDNKIFWPSVIIVLGGSIPFAMLGDDALDSLNSIFGVIIENFSWLYVWYPMILIGFGLYFAFSKYGKVVLGSPSDKPRFTMFQYASIIIAMGLGSSIMRTGSIQWTGVVLDPPFGAEPGSNLSILWGQAYSMFLWSLHTFAIFSLTAPAMGYVLHVRKRPLMRISEVCRCVFGDKFTDGLGGKILDVLFIVAIVAGSASFLGLGTPIVSAILGKMFNIEPGFGLTVGITLVWIILFTVSAYLGIEKGIKNLSTFNMYLAAGFGLLILVIGPGVFIINLFTDSLGLIITKYLDLSFYSAALDTDGTSHIQRYSVFWWAYCATWALLHSVFCAKISKGRTIKEMLLTYFLAPLFLSWAATGILGGVGIYQYITGAVPVMDIVQNGGGKMVAIAEIFGSLPMPSLVMGVFCILTMIFFGTTLDSTTYTIAAYTDKSDMSQNNEPAKLSRLIWAALIAFLALLLMRIGGLVPLEVLSGLLGFPIMFVQYVTVYAAKKMMDQDQAWVKNIR